MKGGYEMRYTLIIAGRLDNMNDYTSACRTNQYKGAKLKQKNENVVKQAIYEQLGRLRIKNPVQMLYRWYEPNKRRDLDNISAFGRKVIQDALVDTRVLQDDGWRYVKGFQDEFYVDKGNPRIEVEIIEDE